MREFFKKYFPADGLGWKIPSLVAALIAIGVGVAALIVWARDALSDFLTANVEVWHLLLGIAAVSAVAVWLVRRLTSSPQRALYPAEVEHFGVIWPIHTVIVGGTTPQFHADMPACPKDRSTLGFAEEDGRLRIFESIEGWENFGPKQMKFGCFKDGSQYDLTGHDVSMREAMQIAVNSAWGKYRTARRKEG